MRLGLKWLAMKGGARRVSCLIFIRRKAISLLMLLQRITGSIDRYILPQSAHLGATNLCENRSRKRRPHSAFVNQQISMTARHSASQIS